MSDLISRSEVNYVIDELEVYACGRPNTMKVEISVLQLQRFINKLKNIPTTYSVDKVVEELEMEMKASSGYSAERVSAFSRAIEIVKQGVVSDDCCEWEPHRNNYVTSCEEDFVPMMRGYKYCPYCGKKIKVVE